MICYHISTKKPGVYKVPCSPRRFKHIVFCGKMGFFLLGHMCPRSDQSCQSSYIPLLGLLTVFGLSGCFQPTFEGSLTPIVHICRYPASVRQLYILLSILGARMSSKKVRISKIMCPFLSILDGSRRVRLPTPAYGMLPIAYT